MQSGGSLLAFFLVTRPMPPLIRHAAILGGLARIAHLDISAALATTPGTTCGLGEAKASMRGTGAGEDGKEKT